MIERCDMRDILLKYTATGGERVRYGGMSPSLVGVEWGRQMASSGRESLPTYHSRVVKLVRLVCVSSADMLVFCSWNFVC
jgi:hypothetical protein